MRRLTGLNEASAVSVRPVAPDKTAPQIHCASYEGSHDRKNWLFVGSQQAGERAAVVLSLIESAKLNGHDPWAYLKDVFERLPTLKQRDLAQLLPHNWRPPGIAAAADSAPVAAVA